MYVDEHIRKAGILEAVYRKAIEIGCTGPNIARGQVAAIRHFDDTNHASAHRSIAHGVLEAERQRDQHSLMPDRSHLARQVN